METVKKIRKQFITIRVNEEEAGQLDALWRSTTERSLSNYLRKTMLKKPVTVKYRNESLDKLLEKLLEIKSELNAMGNNWNQAVKKLHTLDKIPEFRIWLDHHAKLHTEIRQSMEQIKLRMNLLYEKWSLA